MRALALGIALFVAAPASAQVPSAVTDSIQYLRTRADGMGSKYAEQAAAWRARADAFERIAKEGRDPYAEQRRKIVTRAYRSEITGSLQGYSVYLPPDYDPKKEWPLVIVMHGGSSNGNLFLGVVLGNNMNWKEYSTYWWNEFEPRWLPNCIVVSPDGFGQVLWRWMGEKDVLDVIVDTEKHYAVDPNRIVLAGLSNGGVGAYSIGTRHAWRFSVVQAMAGAPSWLQYTGGRPKEAELRVMRQVSGMDLAANVSATDFRYYHGHLDGGPMKPWFVEAFTQRLAELGVKAKETWYDTGHDILYLVEKHGRTFEQLREVSRNPHPTEVRVSTSDYRAARQHWLEATRIENYPSQAELRGAVDGATLHITVEGARAFAVHIADALPSRPADVRIEVNGTVAYAGPMADLGNVAHFVRAAAGKPFELGFPEDEGALSKRPGLSGPLTDAYFGRTVHVYGTGNPETRDALLKSAKRGAGGWPQWLWNFEQPVLADTEVTDAVLASANVVLYTTGADNAVYTRLRDKLPIQITADGVRIGAKTHSGKDVGTRFIYPNPLAPNRYVVVQGGPTPAAVDAGHRLPDFVPDYVIYDKASTQTRPRLVSSKPPLELGFFDDTWHLPAGFGNTATGAATPVGGEHAEGAELAPTFTESSLPVPEAPPAPPAPTTFLAAASDPAGKAARAMAKRIASFPSFRTTIRGATWNTNAGAVWQVRPGAACEAALAKAGVPFRAAPADKPMATPVATPVVITGPIQGVAFRMLHADRELVMSCELATRLPALAGALRARGVRKVGVISTYRDHPTVSFHTFGLAIDISQFSTDSDTLSVEKDFPATPNQETCKAKPSGNPRGDTLRAIVCDVAKLGVFSSVLTPNYNAGHRDHVHLDLRPDDPRQFLR